MVQRHSAELRSDSARPGNQYAVRLPGLRARVAATERLAASLTQARRLRIRSSNDPLFDKSLVTALESEGHAVTLATPARHHASSRRRTAANVRGSDHRLTCPTSMGESGRHDPAAAPLTPILL